MSEIHAKNSVAQIKKWINEIDHTQVEQMRFGWSVAGESSEQLFDSIQWPRIGKNLRTPGLRTGANVPRFEGDFKPITLVTALREVVSNEGVAVNIMLGRIENHTATIQMQKQVITALQFRHFLEHLLILPRERRITTAGGGENGEKEAKKWDESTTSEKWRVSWRESVKQVYQDYKMSKSTQSKAPEQKSNERPFAKLLNANLETLFVKKDEASDCEEEASTLHYLANNTKSVRA
ncbi:MAG: hypothetical protein M1829_006143 [Trizodia sp. TS-e1964]|nr:MAG: hypothetical protein M1829_006143 [Trizodia sp. TS-e1964]